MKQQCKESEPLNIKEFIEAHINEVEHFEQRSINWTIRGMNAVEEAKQYSWFADALTHIKPQLSRSDVREYYEKGELYVGFVATLLWGYAHTNHINNFQKIVATPKDVVEKNINNMITELSVDPIDREDYFRNMCYGGKNHIPGLGVSFFTKVFYFTSGIHGNGTLILDSKLWNVAKAFRNAENNPINYSLNRCNSLDYSKYCASMIAICHRYPQIDAGRLEAYLFEHIDEIRQFAQ